MSRSVGYFFRQVRLSCTNAFRKILIKILFTACTTATIFHLHSHQLLFLGIKFFLCYHARVKQIFVLFQFVGGGHTLIYHYRFQWFITSFFSCVFNKVHDFTHFRHAFDVIRNCVFVVYRRCRTAARLNAAGIGKLHKPHNVFGGFLVLNGSNVGNFYTLQSVVAAFQPLEYVIGNARRRPDVRQRDVVV